jgi:hypothetical protein
MDKTTVVELVLMGIKMDRFADGLAAIAMLLRR